MIRCIGEVGALGEKRRDEELDGSTVKDRTVHSTI